MRGGMNQSMLKGYLYAGAGAALFSTKAIFIKLAYREEVNASLMLALRMAFALPVFVAVGIYAVNRLRKESKPLPRARLWRNAILIGFIGYYLSALLDFEGLVYISAQLERLVLFTYPIFVMFLGFMFFGQRLRLLGLVAAAITYAGLMLVFLIDLPEGGRNTVIGTALVLACAVTFALYQLLAKNIIAAMGSLLFTSAAMTSSAVACLAHHIVVSRSLDFTASPRFTAYAAATALFATVLPSFFVNAGLARISAQATSMIATFSPILTIALAVAVLGESFTLADAAGSALVIAGVLLYALTDKKQPAPE
jgi:drug/metabolite transporter (DMT)-like permease